MAAPSVAPTAVAAYPCVQCGAPMSFDPKLLGLSCEHCSSVAAITPPAGDVPVYDLFGKTAVASIGAAEVVAAGREVTCKRCGASAIVTRQATRCAFCDAPEVVEVTDNRAIPPGGVLPFMVDGKQASATFSSWLRSRWFAPGDLVRRATRDKMDGMYLPFWSFDADMTTQYDGQRGRVYYRTERYTDSEGKSQTREVREVDWTPCSGTVQTRVEDLTTRASTTLPEAMIAKLGPWDLGQVRTFDGRYLAGFSAERYRLEAADGWAAEAEAVDRRIRTDIRADIGGDEQRIDDLNVAYDRVDFRHLLFPLWLSSFHYNGKVFRVAVNARSGEIFGERPYSAGKIILFILTIAALIAAIVLLIVHLKAGGGH
jgi:DNA-directed RNA polymerase subunit RPC12/RpoP